MQSRRDDGKMAAAALGAGVLALAAWAIRRKRAYDFGGKNVLITGGSRGLGLVMARLLAAEGASLALCARDHAELGRARRELERHGGRVVTLVCDLTSADEVRDMIRLARRELGALDVLINNAGIIQVGPREEMTLEDYDEAMRVHFWAPLIAIEECLPDFRARGGGRIVNVSSIGGKIPAPHLLPYVASKFALTGLSEGLGVELAKENICVTTVIPGLMRTGSPRNALFKGKHRAEHAWFHLSDAMPGLSLHAKRAARQILEAARQGRREVVLGAAAKVATWVHGVLPGTTIRALGLVNRALPNAGGIGKARAKGRDSASALAPSPLTALSNRAARRNNELGSAPLSRWRTA